MLQATVWGIRDDFMKEIVSFWEGWLAGWLAGCLPAWLAGWLAGWLTGWLAGKPGLIFVTGPC